MRIGYSIAVLSLVLLLLSGCERRVAPESAGEPQQASGRPAGQSASPVQSEAAEELPVQSDAEAAGTGYIDQVVKETVAKVVEPGMGEYETAKALFDYMIETTTLAEPVGLELWRIRGAGGAQPTFVENRSLSVLLFGIGMCEDYAAAFTMLLRGAGLEAEYVPGLTYSAEGALVDHAWAVAKIDGTWYHLDCQLEDNISRHGAIRYRYFMKSDATLAGSHRWGQNLIASRLLSEAQNEEIAQSFLMPACPQDYPTPARQDFTAVPAPDRAAVEAQVIAELRAYEEEHGALSPLELDIVPPVFAIEGYGPPD